MGGSEKGYENITGAVAEPLQAKRARNKKYGQSVPAASGVDNPPPAGGPVDVPFSYAKAERRPSLTRMSTRRVVRFT